MKLRHKQREVRSREGTRINSFFIFVIVAGALVEFLMKYRMLVVMYGTDFLLVNRALVFFESSDDLE